MSLRTLLLLLATLLYFIGAHWFYTQKVSGICCGADASSSAAIISDGEDSNDALVEDESNLGATLGPLTFNWSDSIAVTGEGFDDYITSVADNLTDYNMLEITGYYFADEETPEGVDNLGLARANEVKRLLSDMIPEDRILTSAMEVDRYEGVEETPFIGADFNWIEKTINIEETTVVEFDEDRLMIFFPFNSSIKDTNKEVDDKLDGLADHLISNGKNIRITGHTDSTGDKRFNYQLGLDRAYAIKQLLIGKGVEKGKIKIYSKGESQPIASNRTREGEHKNRRVVINIME